MTSNRGWSLLALALVAAVAGCADGGIDDPDAPASDLQITELSNASITCSVQSGFCALDINQSCSTTATCVDGGGNSTGPCVVVFALQVEDWELTASNVPITGLATTSPFNDITLDSVLIAYDWGAAGCTTEPNMVGLGGRRSRPKDRRRSTSGRSSSRRWATPPPARAARRT
jgi:hypothetical protein